MKTESINDLLQIKNINDDYLINELLGYQYGAFEDYANSNTFYFKTIEKLNFDNEIDQKDKTSKVQNYYNKIGDNFYKISNLEKSKEYHLKSLEFENACYKCFLKTGIVFLELEKYKEAIEYFNEAIKLNNKDFELFLYRGRSYGNIGETEMSVIDLNSAINLKNNDEKIFFQRGLAYFRSEKYNLAIDDYTQAINIKPNYVYYFNRGLCYEEIGEMEKAEDDYKKGLNSEEYRAHNSLGIFYAENKNFSEAEKYFNLSVKIAKEFEPEEYKRSLYNRAIFYFYFFNDYKKAIDDLNMAIENDKYYLSAYELKSRIFKSKGDNENYLKNLNTSIELDLATDLDHNDKKVLRDSKNFILRALLYEYLGKINLSINDYNEAKNINLSDPMPHYYLAKFYFRNNNFLESLLSISNSITLLKSWKFNEINEDNKYENVYFIDSDDGMNNNWVRISELILFKSFLYKKLNLKKLACHEISLFNNIIDFSDYNFDSSKSPSIFIDLKIERKEIINEIMRYCFE